MAKAKHDYLAVILCGTGSSWGRAPSKEVAVAKALRFFKKDWGQVFEIKGEVTVHVIDVIGFNDIMWEPAGFFDEAGQKIDRPIEHVKHVV